MSCWRLEWEGVVYRALLLRGTGDLAGKRSFILILFGSPPSFLFEKHTTHLAGPAQTE